VAGDANAGYLLDLNALIALIWAESEHHSAMSKWFATNKKQGWATCALTQAGFVRLLSQPTVTKPFGGAAYSVAECALFLEQSLAHPHHQFLSLDFAFSKARLACTGGLQGHRQITDAYLLTLAIENKMKLLTFDKGIRSLLATEAEREKSVLVLN
jgi:toxin-antitoxin system PIN domain toxin